jgi:hypothetical protein
VGFRPPRSFNLMTQQSQLVWLWPWHDYVCPLRHPRHWGSGSRKRIINYVTSWHGSLASPLSLRCCLPRINVNAGLICLYVSP